MRFEIEVLRLDLRVVEDVVQDRQERLGGGAHQLERPSLLVGEVGIEDQLDEPHDGVHRGADFVAHVGEERATRPGGALRDVTRFPHRVLGAPRCFFAHGEPSGRSKVVHDPAWARRKMNPIIAPYNTTPVAVATCRRSCSLTRMPIVDRHARSR